MNEFLTNLLDETLGYETSLPLSWSVLDQPMDDRQLTLLNEENERVLGSIAVLEEQVPDHADMQTPQGQALVRLETKLNILTELVSHLLATRLDRPEPHRFRLNACAIEWICDEAPPEKDALILLSIYLHPVFHQPFNVQVRVNDVTQDQNTYTVQAVFDGLSNVVLHSLEKFIFRHHRRGVAHDRSGRAASVPTTQS
ncbi:MAG: PilZ domain-containing protein [Gammaproteobacteria bacterium]|nr:PilZ domain-containing protein [Gammaproteobacteria bacterium]